jgi:hypothetical protein
MNNSFMNVKDTSQVNGDIGQGNPTTSIREQQANDLLRMLSN